MTQAQASPFKQGKNLHLFLKRLGFAKQGLGWTDLGGADGAALTLLTEASALLYSRHSRLE